MAGEVARIYVSIGADVGELTAGLSKAQSSMAAAASALSGHAAGMAGGFHAVGAGVQSAAAQTQASASAMSSAFASMGAGAVAAGTLIAGAVTGAMSSLTNAVGGLASGMVAGNAEFERYEVQLGVLLGGAQAAKDKMAELAQFAQSTPFELPEVVRAEKILQGFGLASDAAAKAFGFSASQIRTIAGDVAAGAGASFEEIANYLGKFSSGATGEAIARFQELGIVTRSQLAQMGVEFSKSGELTSPLPQAMSAVLKAMQDKYGGMMQAQSQTFEGMKSNLADWAGFAQRTLGGDLFKGMKDSLGNLLQVLGSSQVTSALQSLGQSVGQAFGMLAPTINGAINQIGPALTGLAEKVKSIVNVFQSGGGAGTVAGGLLAALGLDPGTASQVGAVIQQVVSVVQSGVNTLKSVIAGFQVGGVAGGAGALLAALGLDSGTASQITAVMGQIASAIQSGLSMLPGLLGALAAGAVSLLPTLQALAQIAGSVLGGALAVLGSVVSFVAQNFQIILPILAGVVAAFAAFQIISMVVGLWGALTTALSVAQGVFIVLSTAMMGPMIPIALLIGGIAALAVAWVTNAGNIQGVTQSLVDSTVAGFQTMGAQFVAIKDFMTAPFSSIDELKARWADLQTSMDANRAAYADTIASIANNTAEGANSASQSFAFMADNTSTMTQLMRAVTEGNLGAIPGIINGALGAAAGNNAGWWEQMAATAQAKAAEIRLAMAGIQGMNLSQISGSLTDSQMTSQMEVDLTRAEARGQSLSRAATAAAKTATDAGKAVAKFVPSFGQGFAAGGGAKGGGGSGGGGGGEKEKTAEEKIIQAAQAIQSVTETVAKVQGFIKDGLSKLTVGDESDQLLVVIANLSAFGKRMADVFQQAATGLKEDAYKAAQTLSQGISAASQGVGAVVGLLPKLWEFVKSPAWGEMQGSLGDLLGVAQTLIEWGRSLFDTMAAASEGVTEESAKAAQALAQGIGASAQAVSAVVGLLPKLWEFTQLPEFDDIMASRAMLLDVARKLIAWGKSLFDIFSAASAGVSDDAAKAAQNLATGIQSAASSVTAVIDLLPKLLDFANWDAGVAALEGPGRAAILRLAARLISLGRALFDIFAQAASGIKDKSVAAAKRLADGVKAAGDGLTAVITLIPQLLNFAQWETGFAALNDSAIRALIIYIAHRLSELGRLILDEWGKASQHLSGYSLAGVKALTDGVKAASDGLLQLLQLIPQLLNYARLASGFAVLNDANIRGLVVYIARRLAELGRLIFDEFSQASAGLSSYTVTGATQFANGVKAASDALLGLMDLAPRLLNFERLAQGFAVLTDDATRNLIIYITTRLAELAALMLHYFAAAASAWTNQDIVGTTQRTADGVRAMGESLSTLMDLLPRMLDFGRLQAGFDAITSTGTRNLLIFIAIQLAKLAADMLHYFSAAAAAWTDQDIVGSTRQLADGIKNMADALLTLTDLVPKLLDYNRLYEGWLSITDGKFRALILYIAVRLALLAHDIAHQFAAAASTLAADVPTQAKNLADAMTSAAAGLTAVTEAVPALLQFNSTYQGWRAITDGSFQDDIVYLASQLSVLARRMADAFDTAAVGLQQDAVDAGRRLADAVSASASGFQTAIDVVKLLLEPPTIPDVSEGAPLARFLSNLATFARRVTQIALDAVGAFTVAKESGLNTLASSIGDALSVWNGAIDVIKLLTEPPAIPDVGDGTPLALFLANLARFGKRVTQIALDAVGAFVVAKDSGLSTLSSAIGDASSVFSTSLDVIKLLSEPPAIPNVREGSKLAIFLTHLAQFGKRVTQIALDAVGVFTVAKDSGLSVLAQSIGDASSVFSTSLDVIKLLSEPPSLPNVSEGSKLALFLSRLAQFGRTVTRIALDAVGAFTVAKDSGLGTLAQAIGDASSVFSTALDTIKLLTEPPAIPDVSEGSKLAVFLASLARFGKAVARIALDAVGAFTVAKESGLSTLSQAIGDASSVFNTSLDIVKLLAEPPAIPDVSEGSKLALFLANLARFGKRVASIALDAVGAFTVAKDSGLSTLAQAIGDAASVFSTALDTIRLLGEPPNLPAIGEGTKLAVFLARLAQFGKRVTQIALDAVGVFTVAKDSGLSTLAQAIGDASSVFSTSLDIIKLLSEPPNLPTIGEGTKLAVYLARLAQFGKRVTQIALEAVGVFTVAKDSGLSTLSQAIGDASSVLSTALDIIKLLSEPPDIPPVGEGTALARFLDELVRFAKRVTQIALDAVGAFTVAKDSGLSALASAAGDALSVMQSAGDAIKALAERPPLPPLGSGSGSLAQYLTDLVNWIEEVTTTARDAAASFAIAEQSGLSQLSSAAGDATSLIETGLKLPDLMRALSNFTGIDFAVYGPKLDLLIANLIVIFKKFEAAASSAGITDAAQKAVQAFQQGAGAAVDTIDKALDFIPKLLESRNLRLPSGPQVDDLLSPILDIIQQVFSAFSAQAGGIDADTVKTVQAYAASLNAVWDAIDAAITAVQNAAGIHVESSGFNNIRALLFDLFSMFGDFAGQGNAVNQVAAAISTMLGSIQNLVAGAGYSAGSTWISQFAQAIRDGAAGLAAVVHEAMPTPSGGGGGGATTITNNITTTNITLNVYTSDPNAVSTAGNMAIDLKARYARGL